eukprot:CAMPEP_0115018652 /NCGR_PEP_ID=MMETSP0216-20121206/28959_1 /TAXON_ID=223996 /ORGANISM="Protocruzia adherens, Strain Boccale" /LENGTH=205 /DNA_ID=CAMNT_0002389939 /DNA_START=376 /DNA_END=993 /DNA_ORIENTATION=+
MIGRRDHKPRNSFDTAPLLHHFGIVLCLLSTLFNGMMLVYTKHVLESKTTTPPDDEEEQGLIMRDEEIGTEEKKLKTPPELTERFSKTDFLFYQSLTSTVLLLIMWYPFEGPIFAETIKEVDLKNFWLVIVSLWFLALAYQFSLVNLIKKTSALTKEVISHSKNIPQYFLAITLFHEVFELRSFVGLLLNVSGGLMYSYLCLVGG